jgi:hypothetical protein
MNDVLYLLDSLNSSQSRLGLNPEFFKLRKTTEDVEDKGEGTIDKLKHKLNTAQEFAEKLQIVKQNYLIN